MSMLMSLEMTSASEKRLRRRLAVCTSDTATVASFPLAISTSSSALPPAAAPDDSDSLLPLGALLPARSSSVEVRWGVGERREKEGPNCADKEGRQIQR